MALHETLHTAERAPQRLTAWHHGLSRHGRWALYGIGAVAVALLLWKLAGALFAPKKRPPPAPPVKVARALKKDVIVAQNTIGTVVSPAMVQVTAQVGGKLLAANFHEGDIVHKGDILFQIDPAPYEAVLAQAQGQLAQRPGDPGQRQGGPAALPDAGGAERHLQPAAGDPGRPSWSRMPDR